MTFHNIPGQNDLSWHDFLRQSKIRWFMAWISISHTTWLMMTILKTLQTI